MFKEFFKKRRNGLTKNKLKRINMQIPELGSTYFYDEMFNLPKADSILNSDHNGVAKLAGKSKLEEWEVFEHIIPWYVEYELRNGTPPRQIDIKNIISEYKELKAIKDSTPIKSAQLKKVYLEKKDRYVKRRPDQKNYARKFALPIDVRGSSHINSRIKLRENKYLFDYVKKSLKLVNEEIKDKEMLDFLVKWSVVFRDQLYRDPLPEELKLIKELKIRSDITKVKVDEIAQKLKDNPFFIPEFDGEDSTVSALHKQFQKIKDLKNPAEYDSKLPYFWPAMEDVFIKGVMPDGSPITAGGLNFDEIEKLVTKFGNYKSDKLKTFNFHEMRRWVQGFEQKNHRLPLKYEYDFAFDELKILRKINSFRRSGDLNNVYKLEKELWEKRQILFDVES